MRWVWLKFVPFTNEGLKVVLLNGGPNGFVAWIDPACEAFIEQVKAAYHVKGLRALLLVSLVAGRFEKVAILLVAMAAMPSTLMPKRLVSVSSLPAIGSRSYGCTICWRRIYLWLIPGHHIEAIMKGKVAGLINESGGCLKVGTSRQFHRNCRPIRLRLCNS